MHSDCKKHDIEDVNRIKALRLIDDDFMNIFFKGNIQGTELLLKIILERDDLTILDVKVQEELTNIMGRSVVLDIYASDKFGNKYDIEIQRADKGATPKRARFHSSIMDTNTLNKGESYDDIKETYVIFITEHDVLGMNEPIYHIERIIREGNVQFEDGTHIIYVNASMKCENTPLGRLMQDFYCTVADDMCYKELADKVRYFKETEEGEEFMCDILNEMKIEAKNEGILEGKIEGKIEVAQELIKNGKLSLEDIAESTGLSIERIRELAGNKSA